MAFHSPGRGIVTSSATNLEPTFAIAIDGSPLSSADAHAIRRVVVDEAVDRLDAFDLVLAPDGGPGGVDDQLPLGAVVFLSMGYGSASLDDPLMEGEVTTLEPSFPEGGPARLRVRGHDRLHGLGRGVDTRVFEDRTDADVVRLVAAQLGLSAKVDDTDEPRSHTLQRACSHAEFLQGLAQRNGFHLRIRGSTLEFCRPRLDLPPSLSLTWGEDLIACDLSFSSLGQVDQVVVKGWDYRRKEVITGIATADQLLLTGSGTSGPGAASRAHRSSATLTLTDGRVTTQAAADRVAAGELQARASRFARGTGVARGNPSLRSGGTLKLNGLGPFDGAWFVTATRHVFDARTGYRTGFEITRNTGAKEA